MPSSLTIDTLVLGPLETNCYVIRDGGQCWVVDPGDGQPVLEFLKANSTGLDRILLTHGHGDHLAGVTELKQVFPAARLCCPAGDAAMLQSTVLNLSAFLGVSITSPPADELLEAGQILTCGQSTWKVLDTSGHTTGGVSFYCPQANVAISGDALFAGSIGRVDLPGSSAGRLLRNIQQNLMSLADETRVLPGHGGATTVGQERRSNPFVTGYYRLKG